MSFQGCQKSPKANNKSDTLRLSKVTNLPVTNLPVNLYGVKLGESIANKSNNYYISDYTKDPKHLAYMSDIKNSIYKWYKKE